MEWIHLHGEKKVDLSAIRNANLKVLVEDDTEVTGHESTDNLRLERMRQPLMSPRRHLSLRYSR
ncbi:hypothetical protein ABZ639_20010 [Saccharomonospora sp. NPDC006951]